MKKRFSSTLLALAAAVIATGSTAWAVPYSPAQFQKELLERVGKRTNAPAYNAAAVFLQQALSDKRNRKFASRYATSVANLFKKPTVVSIPLQGRAINGAVKALTNSYFKGSRFNLDDAQYTAALSSLLRTLKGTQRTQVNSNLFYNSILVVALKRGDTEGEVYAYVLSLTSRFNIPPPVS